VVRRYTHDHALLERTSVLTSQTSAALATSFHCEHLPFATEQDDALTQEDATLRGTSIQKVHHLLLHQESEFAGDHQVVKTKAVLGCALRHSQNQSE
jgi:hypothetical protein